jgi:phosphate transport system permease protein
VAGPALPALAAGEGAQELLALGTDDDATLGWACTRAGEFRVFRLDDGSELTRATPWSSSAPTALARCSGRGIVAGFADGTLRLGSLSLTASFPEEASVPEAARALAPGARVVCGERLYERTSAGPLRAQELALEPGTPTESGSAASVRHVDAVEPPGGPVLACLGDDGVLRVLHSTNRTNMLTGEETVSVEHGELALDLAAVGGAPRWLALTGLGDCVFLVWEDGSLWRCDTRDPAHVRVVEKLDLLPVDGERVTALAFLIGRTSLAVGDSRGRVRVWFRVHPENAGTPDGVELARVHELAGDGRAVTALAASARTRLLAAGYEDGAVRLFHVTSERRLLTTQVGASPGAVRALALGPRDDRLIAAGAGALALWQLDVRHPEASLASLFTPVWYEGYPAPSLTWQTTGGSDEFEPKYGLVPLVFGTIKATFYSLLFGVPLALLAALYTSEFLHPRHKARVKPAIEMMASLPSVVLGFLAALVLAPAIEGAVPAVLLAAILLPFAACLGGCLWRALPVAHGARAERLRLPCVALALVVGAWLAAGLGPRAEGWLFAGDFRQWLTGSVGRAAGGWIVLLLPLVAVAVIAFVAGRVNPWLAARCRDATPARFALYDVTKFLGAALATVALATALGLVLERLGLDPRGELFGTYVQRNALVVGFAMGFAIIPIVYTLAEDALAAVPDHLRAASLGAGATPWQTAVRVVVPTAMSGLFSAVMIGFGRAVGETMIVLMAAGGTPILDWNVFNGFRSLSANIATELPESVAGGTHYRVLFLAALVLFAMTFALNTLAELVRLRYRRRSVQL